MFTSIAVLVGGILMTYYKIFWIDSVLTLMIAAYLIFSTGSILIQSLKVLMLFTPGHIDPVEISNRICTLTEVENIHHVHVWQLNEDNIHFEAHVDFKSNITLEELNATFDKIRKLLLREFNIQHVTLQPELNTCNKNDLIAESH
jgi:cobalt-zinc-cadmium efflux system protein